MECEELKARIKATVKHMNRAGKWGANGALVWPNASNDVQFRADLITILASDKPTTDDACQEHYKKLQILNLAGEAVISQRNTKIKALQDCIDAAGMRLYAAIPMSYTSAEGSLIAELRDILTILKPDEKPRVIVDPLFWKMGSAKDQRKDGDDDKERS